MISLVRCHRQQVELPLFQSSRGGPLVSKSTRQQQQEPPTWETDRCPVMICQLDPVRAAAGLLEEVVDTTVVRDMHTSLARET